VTWTRAGIKLGLGNAIVRFTDAEHGYVYSWRTLLTTNDGGATWQQSHP